MSGDWLDRLEELHQAATPAPWTPATAPSVPVVTGDGPASEANAQFVAEAHAAVPALIAALRGALALADELDMAAELYDAAAMDGRIAGDLMAEGGHLIQAGDARRFAARLRYVIDGGQS